MPNPIPETVTCPLCLTELPNTGNADEPRVDAGIGFHASNFAGNTPSSRVKQETVVRVIRRGGTFAEAAKEAGYADKAGAHKAWKAALEAHPSKSIAEARDLQDQRLDKLIDLAWAKAEKGNLGAMHLILRAEERRAHLHGLDHADGVAERLVQIEADKVRLMAVALVAALRDVGITDEAAQSEARRVFMRHLRALPAGPSTSEEVAG